MCLYVWCITLTFHSLHSCLSSKPHALYWYWGCIHSFSTDTVHAWSTLLAYHHPFLLMSGVHVWVSVVNIFNKNLLMCQQTSKLRCFYYSLMVSIYSKPNSYNHNSWLTLKVNSSIYLLYSCYVHCSIVLAWRSLQVNIWGIDIHVFWYQILGKLSGEWQQARCNQ